MVQILPESRGPLLAIRGSDTLTADEYEHVLLPAIEAVIKRHQKARLLFYMDPNFKSWDFDVTKHDADFRLRHRDDFEKVAGVCGPKWVDWATKLQYLFFDSEIKTFPCEETRAAKNWLTS
jgi:hypothetical protein